MAGGLLDKLPAVGEDECLCCISGWSFDPVNELRENDLAEILAVSSTNTEAC